MSGGEMNSLEYVLIKPAKKTELNKAVVVESPLWEKGENGAVVSNLTFNCSGFQLHHACIEYPWAASRLEGGRNLLFLGSTCNKSWYQCLLHVAGNAVITDVATVKDLPRGLLVKPLRGVIESTPKAFFDEIIAISTVNSFGLKTALKAFDVVPEISERGDIEVLSKLANILKPGGSIITTLPFGPEFKLLENEESRVYSPFSLNRFDSCHLTIEEMEYYQLVPGEGETLIVDEPHSWERLALENTTAKNNAQVDGVICIKWRKPGEKK